MTSRSRRIRISISQAYYDLLIGQAERQGLTVNVQAYLNLVRGTRDQAKRWRRFDVAFERGVSHDGDLGRDIEQAALRYPEGSWKVTDPDGKRWIQDAKTGERTPDLEMDDDTLYTFPPDWTP
jgi:hypothetical protein